MTRKWHGGRVYAPYPREVYDRRVVTVSLTEAGEALIAELFPQHVRAIVEEMSVLTGDEQETLGRLCRKLGKREK